MDEPSLGALQYVLLDMDLIMKIKDSIDIILYLVKLHTVNDI